jgi:diacylglycerol kinase family enzyme
LPNTYRNIHLIYNPVAGRLQRGDGALMGRVRESLQAAGHAVRLLATSQPGEATTLARQAVESGADLVLVGGGDGTLNEALQGVAHSETPLAVLPFGTANVLACELGLPREPEKVAAEIAGLTPERVSVGFLHTPDEARYFLLMAGVGLDAHIVATLDLELKRKFGKLAYWLSGLGQLGRQFPEFEVAAAGDILRSSFTLASRVRNYGGDLEIAKTACLLDDYFEVVSFEGEDSFRYLMYFTGVIANLLPEIKGVSIRKVHELEFSAPGGREVPVQVDGEFAGRLPATVEIVPRALTLLMPPSFRERFAGRSGDGNGGRRG